MRAAADEAGRWLLGTPSPTARVQLFCFAWAGGSASAFLAWQRELAPQIELCAVMMPGRGPRTAEPAIRELPPLLDALQAAIRARARQPFAFFGHSLGGLVAFELAQRLRELGAALPERLIVSGSPAPATRARVARAAPRSDAELLELLRSDGRTPLELIDNPELQAIALPPMRADFALFDGYAYRARPPLPVPITAFGGRSDAWFGAEELRAWERETQCGFELHWFEGGHFFPLGPARGEVVAALARALAAAPANNTPAAERA